MEPQTGAKTCHSPNPNIHKLIQQLPFGLNTQRESHNYGAQGELPTVLRTSSLPSKVALPTWTSGPTQVTGPGENDNLSAMERALDNCPAQTVPMQQ